MQPCCVFTQPTRPLMPQEPTQAVRQAPRWRGQGGPQSVHPAQAHPLYALLVSCKRLLPFPSLPNSHSDHLRSLWQPDGVGYSSRLAGGYLLVGQPTCHYTRTKRKKKSGGGGCMSVCAMKVGELAGRWVEQLHRQTFNKISWYGGGFYLPTNEIHSTADPKDERRDIHLLTRPLS